MFAQGTGGTINCNLTFNNDTSGNYSIRESVNSGTDFTNHTQSNTDNLTRSPPALSFTTASTSLNGT